MTACNRVGCTISPTTYPKECVTQEAAPKGLLPPVVTQLNDYARPQLRITWSPPSQPNGHIISYTLHRVTVRTSISFDPSYNPINRTNEKFELCRGLNLFSYLDADLLAFSVYEYYVTIATSAGQTFSPLTRTMSHFLYLMLFVFFF